MANMRSNTMTTNPSFEGSGTWQHFYDHEPVFKIANLDEADSWLVNSNDAKDDHMAIETPTHAKVLASNQPCEDAIVRGTIRGTDRTYEVWGIFDGHAGWAMSWKLRAELLPWLEKHLADASGSADMVSKIKTAFKTLDDKYHQEAIQALDLELNKDTNALAFRFAAQGLINAGSCALVVLHDMKEHKLYTAVVGDSRAILLRPDDLSATKPTYKIHQLSVDQNGFNPAERDRVRAEHPNETPIENRIPYRTLKIMVTRAFGDHTYKLPSETIKAMKVGSKGSEPLANALTPPYLTAEPEVTVTDIQKGDVLVMASDGLWDHLSTDPMPGPNGETDHAGTAGNDGAAAVMSAWLEKYRSFAGAAPGKTLPKRDGEAKSLPYALDEDMDWKFDPKALVIEDENAATALIRNSIGGGRRELFTAVMSVPVPMRKMVVDDIAVQVAFF